MKKIILYIILFAVTGLKSISQSYDVTQFVTFSTKEGLTNNRVNALLQDSFGFIWIGTSKGLDRFDGNNFLHFYSDSNHNSLPKDEILKLKILPGNELAATTASGLFIINTQTLRSNSIIIPADSLRYTYKVNSITDIEADEEGNIYLLTRSGFYVLNKERKLSFRYDHYTSQEAETTGFAFGNAIARYENKYLVSAINGLLFFNTHSRKMKPVNQEHDTFIKQIATPDQSFAKLFSDENTLLIVRNNNDYLSYIDLKKRNVLKINLPFLATEKFDWRSSMYKINDSLFAITGKEKGFYLIGYNVAGNNLQFYNDIYFADYRVTQLLTDRENRLWVGTTKGIFKQKNTTDVIEKFYVNPASQHANGGLKFTTVTISNDKIFAGSVMAGLFVLNRQDGRQIKQFEFDDISISSKNIFNCINLNADTVLIGPNGPMLMMDGKSLKYRTALLPGWDKDNWVTSLYKSHAGDVYMGNNKEGQFHLRRNNESDFKLYPHYQNALFKIQSAHSISEDNEGHIWFSGHGMSRYNLSSNSFDKKMDSFPKIKTARKEVLGLTCDYAGNLYFGVPENGLAIYHPSTKHYEHITRSNGLPDNTILATYLLKDKLWIGTESGIACYDIKTKKVTAFSTADDMPDESFSGLSFYFDSVNTHLYAPFLNSVIRFNPNRLKKKYFAPGFFIERIRINEDKIFYHPEGELKLDAGENNLQVTLASINFEDSWQHQFYYRINNKYSDTAWQFGGSTNAFILNNLAPGKHKISFMLTSKANSWPPQLISINVFIAPPFWKTAWFLITTALLIIAGIFLVYKARINNFRQKANRDKQLAELEILSLHAQMNPHFIFNALNSIKEMIWENDKQNASRYLSKFAQLIRTTLEQSRQTFITVKQCAQLLEQYLELEKIRFEDFVYTIEIERNVDWDDVRMAPMLVQPLVENAIWHGLKNTVGNKILEIKFYQHEQLIICEISDNGPGIHHRSQTDRDREKHHSISITNIHSRLQMLNEKYNMHCSLEFIDKADNNTQEQGTIAILRLSI